MKILFATDGIFPSSIGGMQRHSFFLVNHLARLGARLDVLYPAPPAKHFDHPNISEYAIEYVPRKFPGHYLWELNRYGKRISQFINRSVESYDVVYGQGFTLCDYISKKKIPCIIDPHGLDMFQSATGHARLEAAPFCLFMRHQLKRADRVVSKGGRLTEILKTSCRVPEEKIIELPNGVDLDHIDVHLRKNAPKIPNSFLFVGRLEPRKGVAEFLEAFQKTEHDSIKLFLAGDGPLRSRLQKTFGSADIVFLGAISDDRKLFRWYSSCEALVHPALREGTPTVILEAMAARLPVIATDVGGVHTMVDHENGCLIPSGDPKRIASAILNFCRLTRDQKKQMGEAGREKVEQRFRWELIAEQTLCELKNCVEQHDL